MIFAKPAEPDLKLADVNAFVEHSLVLAEKEIADRKIDVRIECDPSISPMRFDADKLNQALLNIYLNAIDAMPEQGRLTVTTRAIENGPAESVEIAIRDNGSGIDEKDLPYLQPFFHKKKLRDRAGADAGQKNHRTPPGDDRGFQQKRGGYARGDYSTLHVGIGFGVHHKPARDCSSLGGNADEKGS